MIDYRNLADTALADITEKHRGELSAPTLSGADILATPHLVMEKFEHGFALMKPQPGGHLLWVLWVDPDFRGQGIGTEMMDALLSHYTPEGFVELQCVEDLVGYYEQWGFAVSDDSDPEATIMTL